MMPNADHRVCVRHLYSNFKAQFKGKELKDAMWRAASASTVKEFEYHMNFINGLDENASEWLSKVPPATWSRSHFSTSSKCDILVNNLSESFNGYILQARGKPILSCIEWIRKRLMKRYCVKKVGAVKYSGPICPSIQDKLEVIKDQSKNCFASPAGGLKFEVDSYETTHVVDLYVMSCTCRIWDLSGIPCKHAVAAIQMNREQPEKYVHEYYSKTTYLKTYNTYINPIPGKHEWVKTNLPSVLPPIIRRPPGRPKKLRKRAADEPRNPYKVSRTNKVVRCGRCNIVGHNTRSCKASITGETPWQRRMRLRKAKVLGPAAAASTRSTMTQNNIDTSSQVTSLLSFHI